MLETSSTGSCPAAAEAVWGRRCGSKTTAMPSVYVLQCFMFDRKDVFVVVLLHDLSLNTSSLMTSAS